MDAITGGTNQPLSGAEAPPLAMPTIPLLPLAITLTIVEGIWSSIMFTREKEAVDNLSMVDKRKFKAPSILLWIVLTVIAFSLIFAPFGYTVQEIIGMIVLISFLYFLISFSGYYTILGIILGL